MNPLETIIKQEIRDNGPMTIGRYMSLALGHPKHGYYMTRDPFGEKGDFTTAPEISQMYGEMIGAWIVDVWDKLGRPESFTLLECGAGRGTLMADIVRVGKAVPDFLAAIQIVLLETSPVLIDKQRDNLLEHTPKWISSLGELRTQDPIIVIGNEFLDALPVRQFQKRKNDLYEVLIGIGDDNSLSRGLSKEPADIVTPLNMKEGECLEVAPDRNAFLKDLLSLVKKSNGVGLFVDYGYNQSYGDTLQAVKNHKPISILEDVGNADLTTHVDFMSLRKLCLEENVCEYGVVKQADFLRALGIVTRAEVLKQKCSKPQAVKISQDLDRLIDLDKMGKLFKVMAFSKIKMPLAGFTL